MPRTCLIVGEDSQRSTIGPILEEIDDIWLAFQDFIFTYTSRSCNNVAHILAKQVTSYKEVWHEIPA